MDSEAEVFYTDSESTGRPVTGLIARLVFSRPETVLDLDSESEADWASVVDTEHEGFEPNQRASTQSVVCTHSALSVLPPRTTVLSHVWHICGNLCALE